jgi:hypothetical protein
MGYLLSISEEKKNVGLFTAEEETRPSGQASPR